MNNGWQHCKKGPPCQFFSVGNLSVERLQCWFVGPKLSSRAVVAASRLNFGFRSHHSTREKAADFGGISSVPHQDK